MRLELGYFARRPSLISGLKDGAATLMVEVKNHVCSCLS